MIGCESKRLALDHKEGNKMSTQKQEDWTTRKWRPMMGWTYMITCIFDFIVAPILWSLIQAFFKGNVTEQWTPLTLQGAGLFHVAMGAILGVTAWSRGQEKMSMSPSAPTSLTSNPAQTQQQYQPRVGGVAPRAVSQVAEEEQKEYYTPKER